MALQATLIDDLMVNENLKATHHCLQQQELMLIHIITVTYMVSPCSVTICVYDFDFVFVSYSVSVSISVSVCLYIYIYSVCMYVCKYVCIYVCIFLYLHVTSLIHTILNIIKGNTIKIKYRKNSALTGTIGIPTDGVWRHYYVIFLCHGFM